MITVIENCVPKQQQDLLENLIGSIAFDWHYLQKSNYNGDLSNADPRLIKLSSMVGYHDYPIFSNRLYDGTGDGLDNLYEIFSILAPVLVKDFSSGENVLLDSLRVNMSLPLKNYPDNAVGNPHVDNDFFGDNKYTALYYVNDSDGDTILYNETYDKEIPDTLTEQIRVRPERGNIIIFNRNILHSGSLPSIGSRIVINLNYTIK